MDRNLYDKQTVKVEKKSGFDKSFQNLYTAKVGSIIPILTDEVIPNTTIDLSAAITAQLPPLASDTFMRLKLKYAAFFVPSRLLVNGYEGWLTGTDTATLIPKITVPMSANAATMKQLMGAGTLADYLGVKFTDSGIQTSNTYTFTALPFLAYHKIYDDWFRNTLIQKPITLTNTDRAALADGVKYAYRANSFDYVGPTTGKNIIDPTIVSQNTAKSGVFADGVNIMDVRQANFDIDLFTSAQPSAQNGQAQKVMIDMDEQAGDSFTISALRSANSIQQFLERNNIAGNRMVDFVKAQYGASLSDGVAQRSLLIGSGSLDVYSKGIEQTSNQDTEYVTDSMNPFNTSVGARYGSAFADGNQHLISNFTAQEPGYVMVVAWLSPKVTYSTGLAPYLNRYLEGTSASAQVTDMANPILQNVGNEPIFSCYFNDKSINDAHRKDVFGYNDRYCMWKDKTDEVHGILRDGQSLSSFALQRTFTQGTNPVIGSDFLKIPKDYLDQVAAINQSISNYGYWVDTFFSYKVSMPLARYSVPTLQDPGAEHSTDVTVDKGGKHLS